MISAITNALQGISKEWVTIIIAALPVAELRGAIPVGLMMGLSPAKSFFLSVLGNSIPIIPVLFLLEPVSNRLRRFKLWRAFFDWLFKMTMKKGDIIQKYEALGLMIFVAVPLPMTGAWSGCIAASLFKIKFRYAFPAILLGVAIAGLIVLAVCMISKDACYAFLK
ncbi:MAG: small multi-drug export protein [Candidatus Omnitrophota bacterium]|nr:small multi-drug export protein [Candidatus Omnitrophota bacterium]